MFGLKNSDLSYVDLCESRSDNSYTESELVDNERGDQSADTCQQISTNILHRAPLHFHFLCAPLLYIADNFEVFNYFQLFFYNDLITLLVSEFKRYSQQQQQKLVDV